MGSRAVGRLYQKVADWKERPEGDSFEGGLGRSWLRGEGAGKVVI